MDTLSIKNTFMRSQSAEKLIPKNDFCGSEAEI